MTDLAIVDPVVRATDEDCEGRDESQQAEANELFFDGTKALEFLTHVYWTSFMTTLVVTAALTFTSPKFSATTDVILRFYGTFNPCIFFDHYPASVLGLLGLTVMDIAGTLWAIFFLLSIAARTDVISTFTYSIPIFVHIGTQLTFSNVFVTDMYAHGYTTAPGPNKSAALTQRNASYLERMNFTAYQRDMVEAHSLWYVVWLFGEALMLVVVCSLVSPRKCGCCCKIFEVETGNFFWAFFMLLAFFGSTVTGAQMLVNFYQYSDLAPVDLRHIPDHEKTWVQRILFGINMAIQQEAWHFFPMLAWRFFRPANFGFHATIRMRSPTRNERNTHEWSKMQPERFISAAFGIIGLSTLGTYLFKDPTVNEAQVKIPLGSGFRQQPYAFLFVPLFTFTIVLIILGVGLAWYRERLMRQSPLASLVCGLLWIAAMIACILIVLPQFDQTGRSPRGFVRGFQSLYGFFLLV